MSATLRSPNRKPRWRAARRQAMKQGGVMPSRRQWAWNVRPQALKSLLMPEWVREAAIKGLGQGVDSVWLWPTDAVRLIWQDRRAGGHPLVVKAELRHCSVCGRPCVGNEAEKRRLLNESGVQGLETPCGADCLRDRTLNVWRKLDPYFRRVAAQEVQR
jgi:hypothetical protein